MKRGTYILLTLFILLAGVTLYSLQLRMDMAREGRQAGEEFMRLPKAEYLKVASLGYSNLMADLLWLKAVQEIGERKVSDQGYQWIYNALDTVTSLDPRFIQPYEVGGLILTIAGNKAELSTKLLEKGISNLPDVWQFPFYVGFNSFFFEKDYKKAGEYMEKASKIPGSPEYLPFLTARLYLQAKDPGYAVEFLARMYESTRDPGLREKLAQRINVAKSDVVALKLQEVVDTYTKRTCKKPGSLEDLIREGILDFVPEDPAGGRFVIGPDGKVKSTAIKGKTGIYTNK